MTNQRFLLTSFEKYQQAGISALKQGRNVDARRNIALATKTMFELAKLSEGVLRQSRLKQANDLYALLEQVPTEDRIDKPRSASEDLAKAKKNGGNEEKEDYSSDFIPVTNTGVRFSDIAGLDEAKEKIQTLIIAPQKHPEVYKRYGRKAGGGLLLYGAPGTGKTMFAKAVASELDCPFFSIKCSDIVSKWFGEAEQKIHGLFKAARQYPYAVIFFDEFESLGTSRSTMSTVMKRVVPQLLAEINGFGDEKSTLMIIAATNRPWDIDSAFMRTGRFDDRVYVPLPDEKARRHIINKQLEGAPLSPDFDKEKLVTMSEGFNGADVAGLCFKVKDPAIKRELKTGTPSQITNEDVTSLEDKVHSSVAKKDLELLAKYQKENP